MCVFLLTVIAVRQTIIALNLIQVRGYFRNFWAGMCRWDPGTLNLYKS